GLTRVPLASDLSPYRDEHDDALVQRMLASITRGQAPRGATANYVESAVGRYMPHLTHSKARRKGNRGAACGKASLVSSRGFQLRPEIGKTSKSTHIA